MTDRRTDIEKQRNQFHSNSSAGLQNGNLGNQHNQLENVSKRTAQNASQHSKKAIEDASVHNDQGQPFQDNSFHGNRASQQSISLHSQRENIGNGSNSRTDLPQNCGEINTNNSATAFPNAGIQGTTERTGSREQFQLGEDAIRNIIREEMKRTQDEIKDSMDDVQHYLHQDYGNLMVFIVKNRMCFEVSRHCVYKFIPFQLFNVYNYRPEQFLRSFCCLSLVYTVWPFTPVANYLISLKY